MAITWYTSAGQPSDSVGVAGDLNWDTTNRITWGPKTSNNTWVGTAYSNIGPVGPAQLSGTGAPASGLGQNGNGYTDQSTGLTYLKSSGSWTQVGSNLGPTGSTGAAGAAGYSQLTTQAAAFGPQSGTTGITLSSTSTAIVIPGSTIPLQYNPLQSSALVGIHFANSGAACTLVLQDLTASSALYTLSAASGSNTITSFTNTQYPMVAGHVYQWQVSGSGTGQFVLDPVYLSASSSQTNAVSTLSGFSSAAGTSFSSTTIYTLNSTNTSLGLSKVWAPYRAGAIYGYQAVYVPSSAGAATATVTATLYLYNRTGQSSSTLGSFNVTNTGLAQTGTLGLLALPTTSTLYIGFTGSGTGQVNVDLQIIV